MTRYVGLRCPVCGRTSPTVDQEKDIRRHEMSTWWFDHRLRHCPLPIIEVRPAPVCPVCETIVEDDDPCPGAGDLDHLDAEVRSTGFYGYTGCPLIAAPDGCPTPWACSERGDCPIVQDET